MVHGPDPAVITRAAIDTLGGMASFVSPGFDVIIKPNICVDYHPPEYAATTNPTVVATLVSMCLEAGAKRVRVMDYPFGGTPKSAYEISGIKAAVEAAGGEMGYHDLRQVHPGGHPAGQEYDLELIFSGISWRPTC